VKVAVDAAELAEGFDHANGTSAARWCRSASSSRCPSRCSTPSTPILSAATDTCSPNWSPSIASHQIQPGQVGGEQLGQGGLGRRNTVNVGVISTARVHERHQRDASEQSFGQWADREAHQRGVDLDRLGRADEVAAAVTFLLTPAASYITGTTLDVAGGLNRAW